MPVYDANQLAQEKLFDVAVSCAQAALKAPQITGKVEIKMQILTGEELNPIMEALTILGRIDMFNFLSFATWQSAAAQGKMPVLLLIGADVRHSDLNYNCGACGFPTCGEFNKHSKSVTPPPYIMVKGPVCIWRLIDYAGACDWACATAWQHNVTNRIEIASGWASREVGYLEDCDVVHGLPLGPCTDLHWYSREAVSAMMDYDLWLGRTHQNYPTMFGTFPGEGRPDIKIRPDWWKQPAEVEIKHIPPEQFEELYAGVENDLKELKGRVKAARAE
ncbi:MAG: DUF2148 domain-containing protein [bacterium]